MEKPVIWVLCGVKAGDTAQALQLAQLLHGEVRAVTLAFNVLHHAPNWLIGAGVSHVSSHARAELAPPWPDLVIGTGKRTARVAAWIRQQAGGKTVSVQLGRPRMGLNWFDLVITTPQYGLPEAGNVRRVEVPFAVRRAVDTEAFAYWRSQWSTLPRPHIAAAIGAAKFPLRLGTRELVAYGAALGALARRLGGSILLFPSPRSRTDAVAKTREHLGAPSWVQVGSGPGNPYQAALWLADQFAVTGDSVSMISEMLATEKSLHVFALPRWPSPTWQARSGLTARLAASGMLSPPRDVGGFVQQLLRNGLAGDLRSGSQPRMNQAIASGHANAVERIRALLEKRGG